MNVRLPLGGPGNPIIVADSWSEAIRIKEVLTTRTARTMLVLARNRYEAIRINHDITITVVDIRNGRVRLGITAPDEVEVHREEVYQLRQAQKEGDQHDAQ
jgi:carbon storage regulator